MYRRVAPLLESYLQYLLEVVWLLRNEGNGLVVQVDKGMVGWCEYCAGVESAFKHGGSGTRQEQQSDPDDIVPVKLA